MVEASVEDPEERGWFTLRWREDRLELLDQRILPAREEYLELRTCEAVAQAIESLAVRGAPAIGCTAAFGLVCAARESSADRMDSLRRDLVAGRERLARTRPTAVNLFWALERMSRCWDAGRFPDDASEPLRARLLEEAQQIQREDLAACRAIGENGLAWVPEQARILTHCNAGGLATSGYGTALGVVRSAHRSGRLKGVLADETRPFLQGARLTAWELQRDGIPVTVVTDGMAGHLMQTAEIDMVVVGADRIARNGDVANKIGTYGLAVLAEKHGIPMCVAAPRSTIDLDTPDGSAIPIEERGRDEIANPFGAQILPDGVGVRHPAFDVTPAELVTAIITEVGVAERPYTASLSALMSK